MTEPVTRTYHSPLRDRRAEETRRIVLQAVSELILSDGLADFSMRDVAQRAEVSERTVYYHFPNRQAVLDGLADWVDEQLDERNLQGDPQTIDDMPGRIRAIFEAFDEIGAPARAMARLAAARGMQSARARERNQAFRERFRDLLDPLDPAEADRCIAIIRYVVSAPTWLAMREDFGLGTEDAAGAVVWALEAMLADLRRR